MMVDPNHTTQVMQTTSSTVLYSLVFTAVNKSVSLSNPEKKTHPTYFSILYQPKQYSGRYSLGVNKHKNAQTYI